MKIKMALDMRHRVLRDCQCGADQDRTGDLLNAIQALSQTELQPHLERANDKDSAAKSQAVFRLAFAPHCLIKMFSQHYDEV